MRFASLFIITTSWHLGCRISDFFTTESEAVMETKEEV
jgi:hypothetical protein